jgi:membrane-bound lytic murein transglycosylase F
MDKQDKLFKIFLLLLFIVLAFVSGWISHSSLNEKVKKSRFDKIKQTKKLRVVLLNSPSTYYIGSNSPEGFEYDLLNSYAKYIGVELDITVVNTVNEALKYIDNPSIDIISASLPKTKSMVKKYNFGPAYLEVHQQMICNRSMIAKGTFPRDVEQLKGLKISITQGTSYNDTIKELKDDGYDINVTLTSSFSTEELLQEVSAHKIDCTIVNSNIYAINQRYYPEIALAFSISGSQQLAWVLAKGSDKLEADMYEWLNQFNQSTKLSALKDHYYSYAYFFNYYDTTMFYKRIKSRLPKYIKYFKRYSKIYGFEWELIAAQSYQESHWNSKAKSFTGVRGLMMLTRHTARLLGIKNRLSPKQSIKGGVRHLNQMLKNIPDKVEGEDKMKFALAAYNVGMGHIQDAMSLAQKINLNQYLWNDLKKVLPLLSQKRYYKTLKHGYARGNEPVRYVEAIYNYKNILQMVNHE